MSKLRSDLVKIYKLSRMTGVIAGVAGVLVGLCLCNWHKTEHHHCNHGVKELLMLSRAGFEMFQTFQKRLIQALRSNPLIQEWVTRLTNIAEVGEVTMLA